MGDRRFTDRQGLAWDVVVRGRQEWWFVPVDDNPGPRRETAGPGYERDPFELSTEELQRLLDAARPSHRTPTKSPFLD
jgi:hypothetical protein